MSSTLPDWLATQPKPKAVTGRVHRLGGDDAAPADPTKPEVTPFVAGDAKGDLITAKGGNEMPKGIYPRKSRAGEEAPGAQPTSAAAAPEKKRRARKVAAPKAIRRLPDRKPRVPRSEERFWISDGGSVKVNLPGCQGTLTAAEATSLVAFYGRQKARA